MYFFLPGLGNLHLLLLLFYKYPSYKRTSWMHLYPLSLRRFLGRRDTIVHIHAIYSSKSLSYPLLLVRISLLPKIFPLFLVVPSRNVLSLALVSPYCTICCVCCHIFLLRWYIRLCLELLFDRHFINNTLFICL